MRFFTVDLYDYFSVKKPEGARADLSCYVRDNSVEVNPNRKNPAMLVIPGGGYGMVSTREGEPIALAFLNKGFNSFVLTYSVAPIRFPYQLTEAVMAMNYIRLNAEELNVDPNMVAAVGFSAGGHLCATLGTICDCDAVKAVFESKVEAKPNGVILSYPVITCNNEKGHVGSFVNLLGEENKDRYAELDLTNLIDEKSAPAFIWATYEDEIVPVKNALLAATAYEKVGVPFSLHIWGKGRHGLSVADKTVYGKSYGKDEARYLYLDGMSKSVPTWIDMAIEWLEEMGICIKD